MRPIHIISGVVLFFFSVALVQGQPYQLLSKAFSSGGGKLSSPEYSTNITFGQPITGNPSSPEYQSGSGFWSQYDGFTNYSPAEFSVAKGWNLVSVSKNVSDYAASSLFPAPSSQAFAFDGGYQARDTLENGVGYWLKFSSEQSFSISGFPRAVDSLDVVEGWNLIGSISSPLAVELIGSIPSGIITSEFFGYQHGYSTSSTIVPGKGYWVKVNQTGTLILSSMLLSANAKIKITPTEELPPPAPEQEFPGEESETSSGDGELKPESFGLRQNYPNPFNPLTIINYQLPIDSWVTLKVYNLLGEEVATLVDGLQVAGYRFVEWDASALSSGIYLYRLTSGTFTNVKRMILLK